jgi:hypothetical protein
MAFEVRELGSDKSRFVMKGLYGTEPLAALFSTFEDARGFVEDEYSAEGISIILLPNSIVSDAPSFWAHNIITRVTGERFIGTERLLISCINLPAH